MKYMDNGCMETILNRNLAEALEPIDSIMTDSFKQGLSGPQTLSVVAQARGVAQAVIALGNGAVSGDFAQELQGFVEELKLQNSGNTLPKNERWKKENITEALSILHRCRQSLGILSNIYGNESGNSIGENIASIGTGIDWFWKSLGHIQFEEFKKKITFFLGRINVFKDELDTSVEYQKTSILGIGRARKEIQENLTKEAAEQEQARLRAIEKETLKRLREEERIRTMRKALFLKGTRNGKLLNQTTLDTRARKLEGLVGVFTRDENGRYFDDTGITNVYNKAIVPKDTVAMNDEEYIRKGIDLLKQHSSDTLRTELEARRMRLQSQAGSIRNFSEIPDPLNSEILVIGNEENIRLMPYITSGDYIYAKLLKLDGSEQTCKFKNDEFSLYGSITLKLEWGNKTINPIAIRYKDRNTDTLVNQPEPEVLQDEKCVEERKTPEISTQETGVPIQSEETQPQRENIGKGWLSKIKSWFGKAA